MQEYSAYIIGPDGHIQQRIDLRCADENAAKEQACKLANGKDVEVWQRDRQIAIFTRKH